jgi:nucleoside transporter
MSSGVRILLSVMMFLQYFVWGSWFVTLGTFLSKGLSFDGGQIGWCYAAMPIAAIISPFIVGMFADRFFATERILAVLHLAGAGLLYLASQQTTFANMIALLLAYALTYMPTLALTNSLSFEQMRSPEKEFPGVRVLGTIGWIAAGLLIGKLRFVDGTFLLDRVGSGVGAIEATRYPMMIGAGCALAMGLFSFFLPHTPPKKTSGPVTARDVLGLDALALLKDPAFFIFMLASFLICMPLQFYYAFTNQFLNDIHVQNPAGRMTYGQMSEIVFMLIMPVFFARLGVKYMLLVGMAAWVARYFLFSAGAATVLGNPALDLKDPALDTWNWMLFIGVLLHGVCYDFFFVTGQIYVDQKAPRTIRAAAQGFLALVTLGVGSAVGSVTAGYVLDQVNKDWKQFWLVPAIGAAVVLVGFWLLFRERRDARLEQAMADEMELQAAPGPEPQVG